MNTRNFVAGIEILKWHFKNFDLSFPFQAEHDIFYVSATDIPLSDENVAKMFDLGWFQPNGDMEKYFPEENWACIP